MRSKLAMSAVVVALAVALCLGSRNRAIGQGKAAGPEFTAKSLAIKVARGGYSEVIFLSDAKMVTIGMEPFLVGVHHTRTEGGSRTHRGTSEWVRFSDVIRMIDGESAMQFFFDNGAPPAEKR